MDENREDPPPLQPPIAEESRRFSQDLHDLAEQFAGRHVVLAELLDATGDRCLDVLLVFLSLPFLTFTEFPGLSTPLGAIVMLAGLSIAISEKPRLPRRVLQGKLPNGFLVKGLRTASHIVRLLERYLRPRLTVLCEQRILRRLSGILIMLSGFFLLLPLPIPFTNSLPAATVILLASGALEQDGAFILAGWIAFLLMTSYFVFLLLGGVKLFHYFLR